MPTYTYRCPHCKATFDRRATIATRDDQRCQRDADCAAQPPIAEDADAPALKRDEIPEHQGRMSHNWGEWQDT